MSAIIEVVAAAIAHAGRCLIAERGPTMTLAGKWEFPGGKVEPGESPEAALRREIREELGVDIDVAERLGTGSARVGDKVIRLDVYAAFLRGGEPSLSEHSRIAWVSADELSSYDWAEADVPSVPAVAAWLRTRSFE
jgi:8-oxo-dGTP diphosphatase